MNACPGPSLPCTIAALKPSSLAPAWCRSCRRAAQDHRQGHAGRRRWAELRAQGHAVLPRGPAPRRISPGRRTAERHEPGAGSRPDPVGHRQGRRAAGGNARRSQQSFQVEEPGEADAKRHPGYRWTHPPPRRSKRHQPPHRLARRSIKAQTTSHSPLPTMRRRRAPRRRPRVPVVSEELRIGKRSRARRGTRAIPDPRVRR